MNQIYRFLIEFICI